MERDRLFAAIASLRERTSGPGVAEAALAARERELRRPIPEPARWFLAAVSPAGWESFVSSIVLAEVDEWEFWLTAYGDAADQPPELAQGGPFFYFARGAFGDAIVLDAAGRVLLADHEDTMKILAESLAGWVERLVAFDGWEYAYLGGELPKLSPERRRIFLADHWRLNPDSEWAARQLMSLDHPGGHPAGHHMWDPKTQRLLPAADAPRTEHIQISGVSQRDVDTVVAAKGCVNLMLSGTGGALDLRPLERMTTLRDLYLYDLPEVDAEQLAGHPALEDVCFLRCWVKNVAALAKIATLKRMRMTECRVDEADYARFKALRPEARLE